MSSANKVLPHYTYQDYCRWEGQWELIEGIPFAMSPSPRPEHQAVAGNLHGEIRAALKRSGCQCKVYQPLDYKIAEDTILTPDLLIVCEPITKLYLDFVPNLVVEILSPSTLLKDRNTKYAYYEKEGVPFYLIVDVDKHIVEMYKLDHGGKYDRVEIDQSTPYTISLGDCSFDITFDDIWS